ncbi:MAG: nickel transporter permease [Chloroflexota bacterium]
MTTAPSVLSGTTRPLKTALRWLRRTPTGALGALLLLALAAAALAAPTIAPFDPLAIDVRNDLAPPSRTHPLGTDHLGRDVLSRLLFGARASLGAAGIVVALITIIGVSVGMVAGFFGGWLDEIIMRAVDTLLAFPSFILALVVAGLLGPGLRNVILGLAAVRWVGYARVVRSLTLSLREREFIEAARCLGAGNWHIMWRHIAPNVLGSVFILTTLDLGSVILSLSGLSFVGLGVQLPHAEWGAMLNYGRPYIQTAPQLMIFPGLAIGLSVLAANLLGDALRDLLDPRYQRYL